MTPRLARWIREHYPGRGELIVHRLSQLLVAAELADGRFPARLDRLLGPGA